MRVAFVLPRVDCNDGVASHVELLSSELAGRGFELALITGLVTGQTVAADRYRTLRRNFPVWKQLGSEQLKAGPSVFLRLAAAVNRAGADVIHAQGLSLLSMLRPAALPRRTPIVASYHPSSHGRTASDFRHGFSGRQRIAYRTYLALFRPGRLIVQSRDTELRLTRGFGVPERRVVRIVGGIDLAHFRPPGPGEREAARRVCVLPGRLNLNKGHDVAVAAFDRLRRFHPGRTILCACPGAGAQEAEIRSMIAGSADPSMFVLPGFVPDMRDVYWASDVVILPSRDEGFALVVAEAMACGCAAIRTPSGGCAEQIVEGETGFVVGFDDADALADRIGRFLHAPTLDRVRRTATAHVHQAVSGKRLADETVGVYRQLRAA